MDVKVNDKEFNLDLSRFMKMSEKQAKRNVRKVVATAFQGIVTASPVDTGFFRANWFINVNNIEKKLIRKRRWKKGRPKPFPPPKKNLYKFKLGDSIFIINASKYAERIESGWSNQAPQGVVEPIRRKVQRMIDNGTFDK